MKCNINNLTRQRKFFSLCNLFEKYTVTYIFKNWALITIFPSWWPPMFWFGPPKVGGPNKKVGLRKEKFSAPLAADFFYGPLTFRNVPLPLAGSA